MGLQKRHSVARERPDLTQLGCNDPRHVADGGAGCLSRLQVRPTAPDKSNPSTAFREIAHKISPPELAIRGSFKIRALSVWQVRAGCVDPRAAAIESGLGATPCFEQRGGPQKTADVIALTMRANAFTPLVMN